MQLSKVLAFSSICTSLMASLSLGQSGKEAWSPEKQQAGFKVPKGFIVELVASEKNGVINPIDMTFDDAGRLWTQTARMYPLDPLPNVPFGRAMQMMKDPDLAKKYPKVAEYISYYQMKKKGSDQILIIDDPTKQAEGKLHVWADGLTIPQSIMPYKNGCYVAHGSELFFMSDENNDGKQDKLTPVLSGFGIFDTHTMAHSIVRAPGGWMYFSHGAVNSGSVEVVKNGKKVNITYSKNARFNLDGTALEVINCHRDNNWGYQIRSNGQWYLTSANDAGYSVLPFEPMMSIAGLGNEKIRPYQPFHPSVHKFRVGASGISGLAFSEDGARGFPKEWKDVAFLANPMTRKLNAVRIKKNADGTIDAEHLPDFLSSNDPWFRPVNIEFGPDGCLYVCDWYNKIISHNEVSREHPDRDRGHGRIWRIRHESQKPAPIPNLIKAKNADLVKHLSAEILWEKRAAWHQIVDRQAKELAPALHALVQDKSKDAATRIHALWSLEGLQSFEEATITAALNSGDDDLKRESIRSLASFKLSANQVAKFLTPYVEDSHCYIRSQVLRTLEEVNVANSATTALLVQACKPAAPDNNLGGNYERNFERFLARKALEKYKKELTAFLSSPESSEAGAENLLWALQALSEKERVAMFLNIWKKASESKIDDNTFVAITVMLNNPEVRKAVAPTFKNKPDEMMEIIMRTYDRINGPAVAQFYTNELEKDLNSGDSTKISKALKLIQKLRSPFHTKSILKLLGDKKSKAQFDALFSTLANDPSVSPSVYQVMVYNNELSFDQRLTALSALAVKDMKKATIDAKKWLPHLNESQQATLAKQLAWTQQGSKIVLQLWELGYLDSVTFDYKTAYMLNHRNLKDWRSKTIFDAATVIEKAEKKALAGKVEKYTKATAKLKGNPDMGKAFFASCTVCHAAGGQGQEIAPPLDGGKDRDRAHLITAIMNPDVAVEAVYALYFVVRKDGSAVEGYLKKSDGNGITIAVQGGAKTFIPKSQILSHGNFKGRSFMPSSFQNLNEQTIADLVAYIKTIK